MRQVGKVVPRLRGCRCRPLNPEVQGGEQQPTVGFSVHAEHAQ